MPKRGKLRQSSPTIVQPIIGPGFRGLNTEQATMVGNVDAMYALVLQNAVFDNKGRIALRKGYVDQTTTPITATPNVYVLHEYIRDNGNKTLIALADDFKVWESTDDGASWSEITGSISTTVVKWKFVNFNDKCYATAPGHKVWEYTGTGTFTQVSDSPVTNGTLLAAFGRLWAGQDGTTSIKYSTLLGGDDWTSTGAGSIDAENAFTNENDYVQGLAAFGASLIVFGRYQILIYVDGTGSTLGIDPDNMYVVDTVEGVGLLYRDTVVPVGNGDLLFASDQGIHSFSRVVQEKANPLVDLTKNVRGLAQDLLQNEVGATGNQKAVYVPQEQMVLYLFPESNKILMIDTKLMQEDGTYRISEWTGLTDFYSIYRRQDGTILFGGGDGNIHKYTGYRDDGSTYDMVYASPWLDFGPEAHNRLKIVKQFYGVYYGRETLTATARWSFDYRPLEFSEAFTNDYASSGAEFGAGEYGEDEYGTGSRHRTAYTAGAGEGQYVKFWLTIQSTDVDDGLAIQELGIMARIGRTL